MAASLLVGTERCIPCQREDLPTEIHLLALHGELARDGCAHGGTIPVDTFQERLALVGLHVSTYVPRVESVGLVRDPCIRTAIVVRLEREPMPPCDRCGTAVDLPYRCAYCGGTYCGQHRLPENHDCPGLDDWGDPDGVFDSGFDVSLAQGAGSPDGWLARAGIETGPGGPLGYVRGNVTYLFLALMAVTLFLQLLVLWTMGRTMHEALFTLSPRNPLYVWTWFTSNFAHSPTNFFHLVFNGIVLYFFGPMVERKTGSKKFAILFLVSGALAGLAQVGVGLLIGQPGNPVLGASGAVLAVMGVLTVLNPNLRVLLFFFLPMPLWVLTLGFAAFSAFVMVGAGIGAGNIAHFAHLIGLVIGLAYGERLRRAGQTVPQELRLGGGRGPGGPGRW